MEATRTKVRAPYRVTVPGLSRADAKRLLRVRGTMLSRCYNPNFDRYEFYGARGVAVCQEWRDSSLAFLEWAAANGYREGLEIDRREGDKPYSPENCRWVTHQQNACNRRRRGGVGFKGVKRNWGCWAASIFVDGKALHLGQFDAPEEAARAYDAAALEHFGEFARLNFQQEARA